ncbi:MULTISPECIES: hypothetical protein [Bacillus]
MPSGKELEQLPISNIALGAGKAPDRFDGKLIKSASKREEKKKINRKQ